MADESAVPSPATPAGTFLSVDLCSRHGGFAMLAMMTLDAHGHGGGRRLLGPKSCCAERREVARWRVAPDDLARIGADLVPPAAALAASAHYATDANLVPLTPLTKDRPCTNCGHVASHDPPGCAECFDEPAAGGLCQTYVPPASQPDATEPTPAEDWRALGVTAIAAENPAVAEYLADLEARLLSLATRVGGVLDALAPPRFVAKCATKGCIRPVFTYDGDLCARCIAALPGASSECPICHRDTPHSHSADAAAPSREKPLICVQCTRMRVASDGKACALCGGSEFTEYNDPLAASPAQEATPPREPASSLASRVEEWVARQCTGRPGCAMDHKFWDAVVAGLRAPADAERLPPGQYRDTAGALRYDGRINRE